MKVCAGCRKPKPLADFVRRKSGSRDGRGARCKPCHAKYMRRWKEVHPNGVGPVAHYRRRYAVQKGDAKRRSIPFLLTFEQWLRLWTESGHIDESGSFDGDYCMARRGDRGGYEIGNVRICTVNDNHREMRHGPSARARIAAANRRRAAPEWRA